MRGNVPESGPEILETRTTLDTSEKLILKCYGVKGPRWTEEKGDWNTEGGAKGDNLQRKRQTWGRGDNRQRMKGGREALCNLCNEGKGENGNDIQGSCKKKLKGKNKTDVSGMLSVTEREGRITQSERKNNLRPIFLWLLSLKNINEQKMKSQSIMGMRWHRILLWLPLLFLSLCPKTASSQGHFPRMENIAAFKPVSTSPPRSTCGFPERSSYCQSPSSQVELLTCYQAFCVQECPYRSSTPPYAPLLLAAHRGTCVTEDTNDTRPGTQTEAGTSNSSDGISSGLGSVLFQPGQDRCLVTPPSQKLGAMGSLTLALWMKPSSTGEMMLLEKSSGQRLVFSLTVSGKAVILRYSQSNNQTSMNSFRTEARVGLERWTHFVLQKVLPTRNKKTAQHTPRILVW